jgi:hypothetical protein
LSSLARAVDCWVETEKGVLAYWIIGAQMRDDVQRSRLKRDLASLQISMNVVFTANVLRESETESSHICLSTTERDFL